MSQPHACRAHRIRQLVWACESLSSADDLKRLLDLGEPFADPGVAEFGLENAVFAIGDQFLEVVAPLPGKEPSETAAGRFLARGGPGGYMAIFQTSDLERARNRLDELAIRRVWNIDLDSISASHLHPADVGAAIVSIDEPRPPGSWLWGGPGWEQRSRPGRLVSAGLTGTKPDALAARWASALGVESDGATLPLDEGRLDVRIGASERLASFGIEVSDVSEVVARAAEQGLEIEGASVEFQGVRLHLTQG